MAKHLWTVVCRQAVVDRYSNTLSLFEVIEGVHIKVMDSESDSANSRIRAAVDFFVVTLWVRDDVKSESKESCVQRIRCIDPEGKVIAVTEQSFVFEGKVTRNRNIFNARAMPISSAGSYTVQIQIAVGPKRWKLVSEIPVAVELETVSEPPKPAVQAKAHKKRTH